MSAAFSNWDERTLDLAIDRFTVGVDRDAEANLDRLADARELEELEHTLAAIHLSFLESATPPASFIERLEREGRKHVQEPRPLNALTERSSENRSSPLAWAGWLAAAALVFVIVILEGSSDLQTPGGRGELIASATDLVRVDWAATGDPASLQASGDVVWSSERQEGYMLFRNLEPNDPTQAQYQLWIFDPTRADWEAKPVDGGVFDVGPDGEVVVPINAKLEVRETALFAVTLEVPGGVVVSERERLVLAATPE